ncbi:MAG: hypothetical protein WBW79_03800 [Desulfocapsaceae bacterium]
MDWVTKLTVLKHWHVQSELRQQAMVRDYLVTHPGISTSDDWLAYLAATFGVGRMQPGSIDLGNLVH